MKTFLRILMIIIGLVLFCAGCGAGEDNKNTESKTEVQPHKEKEIHYDIIPEQLAFLM